MWATKRVLAVLVVAILCGVAGAQSYNVPFNPRAAAGGSPTDYTADGDMYSYWLFEQASSSTLLDETANNVDLSSVGSPVQDGTNFQEGTYSTDYVAADNDQHELADTSLPSDFPGKETTGYSSSITVMCWARPAQNTAYQTVIAKRSSWILGITSSGTWRMWVNSTEEVGSTSATLDAWVHVAGVFDDTANELQIYVNGANDGGTATSYTGSLPLTGANMVVSDANNFDGNIDECALFTRALDATEICEICRYGLDGAESDRTCGSCTLP